MQALENSTVTPLAEIRDQSANDKRKRLFSILGLVVALGAILGYTYWALVASKHVSTNNAYTAANIAQVTSSTSGTIKAIHVVDTQSVKAGDVLVTLDDTDAQIVLRQAEAAFARAESDLARMQSNYDRRQKLVSSGYLSKEDFSNADSALKDAKATMDAANATLAQAKIDLDRIVIRAPTDGIVAKREVQLGQRISNGTYLLSVIPVSQIYVNANFKEVQLKQLKPGQPVEVRADIYGSDVTFHGRVAGIAGGTGSSFSTIPAQNATGNWIKVVQRVPVRIELDPQELAQHPLQVGLSMNVDIYTGNKHA